MTVTTQMEVVGDKQLALRPSAHVDAVVLAANTAEAYTVPDNAYYVVFSADADFYVTYNETAAAATAAVPAADVTNGSASELNPTVRFLGERYAELSMIAPTACVVTITCYRK